MFVDMAEYRSMDIIACPLRGCDHVWCRKCERSIKRGGPQHSCDGSNELEHLAKASGWRHCPGKFAFLRDGESTEYWACSYRLSDNNPEAFWLQSHDSKIDSTDMQAN